MSPNSANRPMVSRSLMSGLGSVNGPINMPATKYPSTGGCLISLARARPAATITIAMAKSFKRVALPSERPAAGAKSRTSMAMLPDDE